MVSTGKYAVVTQNTLASHRPHPLVICGPTASGKTDLAQAVAQAISGAVLSADSMQVYRGMDIGTGKLPPAERVVDHYGFDLVDPGEPFSAAIFQTYGRSIIDELAQENRPCVLCGGTGFYIRAVIDNYTFPAGEQVNNPIRDTYLALWQAEGSQALWQRLFVRDPDSARVIHPHDTKRVIRAFELLDQGTSYAYQRQKLATIDEFYTATHIGIAIDPDVLRQRIDQRVDTMIEAGLVDEVSGLLDAGFRSGITAPQAIGYKEIVAFLDGLCTLDEAIEKIKTATKQYAKRQRTWFRKDTRIHWIDGTNRAVSDILAQALAICAV